MGFYPRCLVRSRVPDISSWKFGWQTYKGRVSIPKVGSTISGYIPAQIIYFKSARFGTWMMDQSSSLTFPVSIKGLSPRFYESVLILYDPRGPEFQNDCAKSMSTHDEAHDASSDIFFAVERHPLLYLCAHVPRRRCHYKIEAVYLKLHTLCHSLPWHQESRPQHCLRFKYHLHKTLWSSGTWMHRFWMTDVTN